jgi:hypothetical protein
MRVQGDVEASSQRQRRPSWCVAFSSDSHMRLGSTRSSKPLIVDPRYIQPPVKQLKTRENNTPNSGGRSR